MSFKTSSITDKSGLNAIPIVYQNNANVALVIYRRINGNLVVYEVELDSKRHIKSVDMFWLDLDTKYKRNSRKKGKSHDRDDFNKMDNHAYGITISRKLPTMWEFHFNRFSERKFFFLVNTSGVSCFSKKGSNTIKVHHLYIHDKPALGFLWPSVEYINLIGFDTSTKQRISERIKG